MAKHAPGPWRSDYPRIYSRTGAKLLEVDEHMCCTVYDAQLIAAAPEMLQALRKAVVLLAGVCVHSPELEPHETYEAVSAAIAKATGCAA